MNERIDHNNYEAWLLDRLEGQLTPEQERELDAFLLEHPELASCDDELPVVDPVSGTMSTLDKDLLKRSIPPVGMVDDRHVEDHLIARLQGDLDVAQLEALRSYLVAHPEWQRADRTYALTKLVPEAVAFFGKQELVRHLPPQGLVNAFTVDDHLIARLEGELSAEQAAALNRFLEAHPAFRRNEALINATRTTPGSVVYVDKASLKKKEGRVIAFRMPRPATSWAAAATVALLIVLGLVLRDKSSDAPDRFARVPLSRSEQRAVVAPEAPLVNATVEQAIVDRDTAPAEVNAPARESRKEVPAPSNGPGTERSKQVVPIDPVEQPMIAGTQGSNGPTEEEGPAQERVEAPEEKHLFAEVDQRPERVNTTHRSEERTVGELLASTLRERLLDTPARTEAPLDGADAVAAVDRTLKAVSGDRGGLELQRRKNGGVRGFDLRLGRNFSVSASR
ncbi:MAG: hypothetical protein R2811_10165 [Flavobacteriales bacterium]